MTTDELVAQFIAALKDTDLDDAEIEQAFERFDPRKVLNDIDRDVWSIALNYDTRDVRFVEVDGGAGRIGEVRPETQVKVRTAYVEC